MYAFIYDNIDNITLESMLIDNEFDSLMYESNMVDVLHEQTKNDIRFKIMTESGDMSDLAFLYEEAEKVANGKKKNIFTRIVEFIGRIVNSIINAAKTFFNSLSGEDEKEDKGTELPENIETNVEQLEQETNKITQIVNMFTGNNSKALDALKKISVPILGAAVGFAVKHGVKRYFKNKKKSLVSKLENCAKKLGENAKKAGSFVGDGAGSILGKIKDLTSSVNTSIKTIVFRKKDGDKENVSEAKAAKIKEKAEKKRKKEFEKTMKKRRKEIEKNRKKYGNGNDYLKNPDKI